jgi:hypothetical protein
MFGIPIIEWIGYLASVLVALSLTMSSIIKLRWINLVGATLFTIYGFIIGAIPVALVNGFIAIVNIVFLSRLLNKKEAFKLFKVNPENKILREFLEYHKREIKKLAPDFNFNNISSGYNYLIIRNMDLAGVFIGEMTDKNKLFVQLDFVAPKYRDFKLGDFIYNRDSDIFKGEEIKEVEGEAKTKAYRTYFERMGFEKINEDEHVIQYRRGI